MKDNNKRKIYIGLFVVLGVLLGVIVHGLLELWYTNRLLSDFVSYSLGYTWADWFTIHKYFSVAIFIFSLLFGYFQGKYWWWLVYEEKRLAPFFKKVRKFFHIG